ncbi:hypothetical protein [Escherichia coli]|uniref:hypothetical protein n=1 Tax=Escherichia coli TaxID=562 RepID=UPI003890B2E3
MAAIKQGDLVDCSAVHQGSQWRNRTLAQIAADLCAPFGISVRWQVNDVTAEKPFASFTLENSETVADALTRAARHRGVLVTSNAAGELVFTQAGSKQTDTLVLGENLLEAIYNDDHRMRYSEPESEDTGAEAANPVTAQNQPACLHRSGW